MGFNQQRQAQHSQPRQQTSSQSSEMSLEDMVKSLASSTMHFQQETKTSIKNLETQVSQLANTLGKLEAQGLGKLPSQAINPRENVSAMTLRSEKVLEKTPRKMKDQVEESTQENNLACEKDEAKTPTSGSKVDSKSPIPTYVPSPPFPCRFVKSKRDEHENEILETFRKVQVNIPLLDAIYQVPHYAKFLKELCTNKHRLKDNEVVSVGENVLTVLQKKLPPKCKDPGSFTIPCIIGNTRSNAFPKGVLEDVLVQVNELIFPADFYVLDMQDESTFLTPPLLLGRPFMRTASTKIDVHDGTLTTEFDGEIIRFNIFETMRYSSDVHACFSIAIMDSFVQKNFNLSNEDALDTTLIKSIDVDNLTGLSKNLQLCEDIVKTVASLKSLSSILPRYNLSYITLPISKEKLLPSVMQASTLELKSFPEHLKYVWERGKQYR
ncbi:uncharacterized protein LOC111392860 [Olea europaea var. sylvestris]|uniref:uncharacterized protein LOC111392860 n=1 Tax=Olea europaea var. sylvestris TaxID=158386 RepID=UPI000C1D3266|nr:uncharacterized protein LOC111392860 [Olea europaea var. sylvestris]